MNIYFINPKDFEPSKFHVILELLKVKVVLNLIPSNAGINSEAYIDDEIFEDICYEDLSYIPVKPRYRYVSKLSHEICNYILPDGYIDILGYIDKESDMPFKQSNAKDFIANIKDLDDPNILIFFNAKITDVAKNIYKELFKILQSREMENRIPILYLKSWVSNPERCSVSILRKMTEEDKKSFSWAKWDSQKNSFRDMTNSERRKMMGYIFWELRTDEIPSKYDYFFGDSLCYLYYMKEPPIFRTVECDEWQIKIEMAQQLFTKEAQHKMNEKIEELEEERREMEYQEWLHADEIDDTDYERETYYALGGDDYDGFREEGGSIDAMMDGLGY